MKNRNVGSFGKIADIVAEVVEAAVEIVFELLI